LACLIDNENATISQKKPLSRSGNQLYLVSVQQMAPPLIVVANI